MLEAWAIPGEIAAGAPESPYFFDPAVFVEAADESLARAGDSPSDAAAREALPSAGTVLDVGAGAGAASIRLGPGRVVAVDPSAELLAAFESRAAARGLAVETVEGRWPDVAAHTPVADVAVCHHVVYNVPDLAAFAAALASHARRRVVLELTVVHPMAWMAPYWEALHGVRQPRGPTAEDAVAVLRALGLDVHETRWARAYQMIGEAGPDRVARIARRLCLPRFRHDELRRVLDVRPPPRERAVATLWWDSGAAERA
jgi:SAM-dependent methyltransferase